MFPVTRGSYHDLTRIRLMTTVEYRRYDGEVVRHLLLNSESGERPFPGIVGCRLK